MSQIEHNLRSLGITLPTPSKPAANYVPYVTVDNLVYISGQLPIAENGYHEFVGTVPDSISLERANVAAKYCAINIISQLKLACQGNLEKVSKIVKLNIFVNSSANFEQQPAVGNGASDLMLAVFGEKIGSHARSAVGVAALPFGVAVEIDAIAEIKS